MSDSWRRASAQPLVSLVPGVVYEWTLDGVAPVEPLDSQEGTQTRSTSTPFVVGSEPVAGYHLAERIGEGGTGEVWRAIGPGGVAVALKFIATKQRGSAQELRSLAVMPAVRHANLVTLCGIWEHADWTAIGMDLADGSLLDRFAAATEAGGPGLGVAELTDYLRQAARGIDFLNQPRHAPPGQNPASLIHRDIKPQNLLLVGGSVKVGDFGLVKRLEADSSRSMGLTDDGIDSLITAYTSPEIRRGGLSSRSDQYSLAATYCHLRGGRVPSTPRAAPRSPVEAGSDLPLDAVDLAMLPPAERPAVARALATDPAQRWPSCSAFVEALVAATQQESKPGLSTPTAQVAAVAPVAPNQFRWTKLGAVLTAAALVAFVSNWSGGSSPRPPAMPAQPNPVATLPPSPPPEISADSVIETTLIAAQPPTVLPQSEPVVAPSTDLVDRSEPVVAPSTNLMDRPDLITGPTPELVEPSIADSLDDIVAAIEAHPVVGDGKPALSGAAIKAVIQTWVDMTWDHLEARVSSTWTSVAAWVDAIPRPAPSPVPSLAPLPPEPPAARAATIIVRMPSPKATLIVRGEMGQGNPDEWSGPRRVIHSPPLVASRDYLIGGLWADAGGRQVTRSLPLKVEPGRFYEVDLQSAPPTASEVSQPPFPKVAQASPAPALAQKQTKETPAGPAPAPAQKQTKETKPRDHPGLLNRLPLPHLKRGARRGARP